MIRQTIQVGDRGEMKRKGILQEDEMNKYKDSSKTNQEVKN